jgi:hypothetical protein
MNVVDTLSRSVKYGVYPNWTIEVKGQVVVYTDGIVICDEDNGRLTLAIVMNNQTMDQFCEIIDIIYVHEIMICDEENGCLALLHWILEFR